MDCIFCKIINKELKSEILLENEKAIVFYDIHPKAPFHVLIVPKIHIESIKSDGSGQVVPDLVLTAKQVARQQDIVGYKLVFNVGKEGGQEVEHLHMHMLSGRSVSLP